MAIETTWSTFESGKYKGRTAPEVAVIDPAWFCKKVGGDTSILPKWEGMEIWYKARSIAIPKPDPDNWRIGWVISSDNELVDFHVVKAQDVPGDFAFITDHVDFGFVSDLIERNPKASKRLSVAFRRNYFGGAEATKERCEAFFSNDDNFIWQYLKPSFFRAEGE